MENVKDRVHEKATGLVVVIQVLLENLVANVLMATFCHIKMKKKHFAHHVITLAMAIVLDLDPKNVWLVKMVL